MGLVNEAVCTIMLYLHIHPTSIQCYSLGPIDFLYFPVGIYFWI